MRRSLIIWTNWDTVISLLGRSVCLNKKVGLKMKRNWGAKLFERLEVVMHLVLKIINYFFVFYLHLMKWMLFFVEILDFKVTEITQGFRITEKYTCVMYLCVNLNVYGFLWSSHKERKGNHLNRHLLHAQTGVLGAPLLLHLPMCCQHNIYLKEIFWGKPT